MADKRFKAGLWVAMVTPMKAGGVIDLEGLKALVDFHVEAGTDGLVPCGTTGESATFSHDEHQRVVEAVVAAAAGRISIMAGTGSNSTREAMSLTRHAQEAGADGALVITPYYNKPTQGGLERHFKEVAAAAPGFPICLYNVPGRTSVDMEPETAAAIAADTPSVTAIKEASGSLDRISELMACAPGLDIYSGDDSLTLPMLSLGARGVVSVVGNLAPKLVLSMLAAHAGGDAAEAARQHHRLYPLMKGVFMETNPIPVKSAMAMLGRLADEFRLPLLPASDETRARLKAILGALEID